VKIDETDRELMKRIQKDFPLRRRPFREIGEELGINEVEAIERISALSEEGLIRNISPKIRSSEVGYEASTLVAVKIEDERIEEAAEIINRYDGVTHNYERTADYNLWFTLHAETEERLNALIEEIEQRIEPEDVLNLPKEKKYKLHVDLDLEEVKDG